MAFVFPLDICFLSRSPFQAVEPVFHGQRMPCDQLVTAGHTVKYHAVERCRRIPCFHRVHTVFRAVRTPQGTSFPDGLQRHPGSAQIFRRGPPVQPAQAHHQQGQTVGVPAGAAAQFGPGQHRLPRGKRPLPGQFHRGEIRKTAHGIFPQRSEQFPQRFGPDIGCRIGAFPQTGGQHDHRIDAVAAQDGYNLRRLILPAADGSVQFFVPQGALGFFRQPADVVAFPQKVFRRGFSHQVPRSGKQYVHRYSPPRPATAPAENVYTLYCPAAEKSAEIFPHFAEDTKRP